MFYVRSGSGMIGAMTNLDSMSPGNEVCVTASELVRQFGLWQERALQQPVFVLRRGRPSLVLTSLDLMRRLCAPHQAPISAPLSTLLMDMVREAILVIDATGRIDDVNRAARLAFAIEGASAAQSLSRLFGDAVGRYLLDLAERARRLGVTEQAEIALGPRRFRMVLAPHGDRTILLADDTSAIDDGDAAAGRLSAIESAADALGDTAWVRINLRGYIDAIGATLPEITGIDRPTLLSVRVATLLDPANRAEMTAAIEAVIGDGATRRIRGRLQRREGTLLPVVISLAAARGRGGVEHLALLIRPVHDFVQS